MPRSQNLKQLQKTWYQKLKKSGFVDIEDEKGNLRSFSTNRVLNSVTSGKVEAIETNKRYYEWAQWVMGEVKFESPLHKKIWQLHSEGLPASQIARDLKLRQRYVSDLVRELRDYIYENTIQRS